MANITPRVMWTNFVQYSNTIITPTSNWTTMPWSIGLRDQMPSRVGRSMLGWNIIEGVNDSIDMTEATSGDFSVTIAPGNYATGVAIAEEVKSKINAGATDNTYQVTYATTYKFVIGRLTGTTAFGIEWNTGPNAATTIGRDLGYYVTADDTGLTTYIADTVSYQGLNTVEFDFGTARGVQAIAVLSHNISSTASIVVQGHTSAVWSSPGFSQTLTWNEDKIVYFPTAQQDYRYWRIYMNDVQNTDGFNEIGVFYLGSYTEPSRSYSQQFAEPRQELSSIALADHGAHYYTEKPSRKGFSGQFKNLSANDRTALEAFLDYAKQGRNFFFALDPLNEPNDRTLYGSIAPTEFQHAGGGTVLRWNLPLQFAEALG